MSRRSALHASTRDLLERLEWHALGGDTVAADAVEWIRAHELDALNLAAWRDAAQALTDELNVEELDLAEGVLRAEVRARAERAREWVNGQPVLPASIVLDHRSAVDALSPVVQTAAARRPILEALEVATIARARS